MTADRRIPGEPRDDLLDETIEDLYENAPCGYLTTWPDGRIAKLNKTLSTWLGRDARDLVGELFIDQLTAGGRIHYETHFGPMLRLTGQLAGITVDLVAADGTRLPVFLTANVKKDEGGNPVMLRITAQDARVRREYERELLHARRHAENERARIQALATTLQRSLLPPSLVPPEGMDAVAYYHPASSDEVGGDFYDLFALSNERWGFFLGDVSGKGAAAAAVTSLTRYTLRAAAVYDDDPVAVLHNLNTVLNHEFHGSDPRFCTVIFGLLTPSKTGFDVHLAGGGHPPALLLYGDGQAMNVDLTGGQLVGILPNPRFVATRLRLSPGDTLVLYSDGLTEAQTGVGQSRYDDDGALLKFAAANSPSNAATIVDAIRTLLDGFGSGLQDDTAVLALGIPDVSA